MRQDSDVKTMLLNRRLPEFWHRLFLAGLCILGFAAVSPLSMAQENIALGRPYTLDPDPNYEALARSDLNRTRLTDGEYAPPGSMWGFQTTVGWHDRNPLITIDLGSSQAISGVMFHTVSCGSAGVSWPNAIILEVSDDGEDWSTVGDMVEFTENITPAPEIVDQAVNHQFVTPELDVKGRYLRIHVMQTPPFVFSDEIEVYGKSGTASVPAEPGAK